MGEAMKGLPALDIAGRVGGRQSPPGYSEFYSQDPRNSSTQSLVPSLPEYQETVRRTLLIVYLHGFMGNDTSFQSFPAHVHKFLKLQLTESHVIHSKIYPKYKTYKAIEVARDNFSKWLAPHESATTDVIIVGHSMGGLLAADVVLMPTSDQRAQRLFQHRLLGTVHLDAPLLGLHPGIIVSGISSLFRPKADPPKPYEDSAQQDSFSQTPPGVTSPGPSMYSESMVSMPSPQSSTSPLSSRMTFDPTFNPEFPNDVRLKDRGWWKNVVHFVKKHNSEGLVDAATDHIMSHLEFGSCLMDFNGLKLRYENLRKLEDVDDIKHHGFPHVPPQVRFVQYYTVCYGYPKKPKTPRPEEEPERQLGEQANEQGETLEAGRDVNISSSTPGIPAEYHSTDIGQQQTLLSYSPKEDASTQDHSDDDRSMRSLERLDPEPMSDEYHTPGGTRPGSPQLDQPSRDAPPRPPAQTTAPSSLEESDKGKSQAPDPSTGTTSTSNGGEQTERDSGVEAPQPEKTRPVTSPDVEDELASLTLDLPAIPDLPAKPSPPDLDKIQDKDVRKQVEKEAKRVQKAYDHTVKNRDKAIKERQKIIEKRKKKRAAEAEKREKEAQKQRQTEDAAIAGAKAATVSAIDEQKSISDSAAAIVPPSSSSGGSSLTHQPSSALTQETSRTSVDSTPLHSSKSATDDAVQLQRSKSSKDKGPEKEKPEKPKKERKFCNLPSKVNGQVDPKWVKIFMKDVDEVGAHTGLFFPGPHYEKLVGDVGDMILSWVQEDATKRAILEMG
ncbi:hypothetical protein BJ170DRAFT_75716 [Xylariales sp. AK1849]|nr:hypothetical protein BJ170DRAFT_75716 [Xylariales sp. AK1849]